jgi:hypothetical protein
MNPRSTSSRRSGRRGPAVIALLLAGPLFGQAATQFTIRTPAGVTAASLREAAVGDFDGDGDLDLCGAEGVFLPPSVRQVMLRNDGMERFTNVSATSLPVSSSPTLMTVAFDMDGDSDVDLFLSKQLAPSRLWRNNGAGVFTDVSVNLPAAATDHLAAVTADFDGDGDLDIAAMAGYFSTATDQLLVNNGAGVFAAVALSLGAGTTSMAAADIDGDGDPDLAVGAHTGPRLFRNDGNMAFTDVTAVWLAGVQSNVLSVALGDLDGDGDPDLVLGRQNVGGDLVLRNTGSGFTIITTLPGNASGTKAVALFDCDEDGDLDLARAILSGQLALGVNDGSGTLVDSPTRIPSLNGLSPRVVAFDVDRDADQDLLVLEEIVTPDSLLINRHRDLLVGPAAIGAVWTIQISSAPGYATLHHLTRLCISIARLAQPMPVPGFGDLFVDLDAPHFVAEGIVLAGVGVRQFAYTVPSSPLLVGVEMHLQALVDQEPGPVQFTGYHSVVVQ